MPEANADASIILVDIFTCIIIESKVRHALTSSLYGVDNLNVASTTVEKSVLYRWTHILAYSHMFEIKCVCWFVNVVVEFCSFQNIN